MSILLIPSAFLLVLLLVYGGAGYLIWHQWLKFSEATSAFQLEDAVEETRWQKAKKVAGVFVAMMVGLSALLLVIHFSVSIFVLFLNLVIALNLTTLFGIVLNRRRKVRALYASCAFSLGVVLLQHLYPTWLLGDLLAYATVLSIMVMWQRSSVRTVILASIALVSYDAFSVYVSGLMLRLADTLHDHPVPMILTIPRDFHLHAQPMMMAGLGDLLFPGLWVVLAFRMAKQYHKPLIVATTMLGVVLGWVTCTAFLLWTQKAVPALIFLMPCTGFGYAVCAIPGGFREEIPSEEKGALEAVVTVTVSPHL